MKMSIFFKSLRSMKRSGSKSRTSPAMRAGSAEASKRVIGPMPERPATRLSQFASMPMPSGVTRPRPVTTTRRRVPFRTLKARNASAARAGVKVAWHVRPGGLDAEFFSIFVGPWRTKPEGYYAEAMKQFDAVHAMIQAHPETIAWARTAADVRANAERKRISALFGVEGGHALLPGGET